MTYTKTISRNGQVVTEAVSDTAALTTLRSGQRHGGTATVAKNRTVTITRTSFGLDETGSAVPRETTVTLAPAAKQPRLTPTQYADLQRIRAASAQTALTDGRIRAGMWSIPPTATKRLLERGLAVISEADGAVVLGVAGLLATAAFEHQTWTSRGSEEVTDNGRINWGYFASAHCSCKQLRVTETTIEPVRLAALNHLTAALTRAVAQP